MKFLIHNNKKFFGTFGDNYTLSTAPAYTLPAAKVLCRKYRAYPVPIEDRKREEYLKENWVDFLIKADMNLLQFLVKVDPVLTDSHLFSNMCEEKSDFFRYQIFLEYRTAHKHRFKENFDFNFLDD